MTLHQKIETKDWTVMPVLRESMMVAESVIPPAEDWGPSFDLMRGRVLACRRGYRRGARGERERRVGQVLVDLQVQR
jgi:hypothetical protein